MTLGYRQWLPTERKRSVQTPNKRQIWLDASEVYRPEGSPELRNFDYAQATPIMKRVYETYLAMHTQQTLAFVRAKKAEWLRFDHAEMEILPALDLLNGLHRRERPGRRRAEHRPRLPDGGAGEGGAS